MDRKNSLTIQFLLLLFFFFLLFLLLVKPYLWCKLSLVRFFLKTWLGPLTPYVHPIPYYKGINLQYPFFCALASIVLPNRDFKNPSFWKHAMKMVIGLTALLLLDCFVTGLEIGSQKLTAPSNWLSLFILFSLSLGLVMYPLIIWFLFFYPFQRKTVISSPKAKSKT